MSACLFIIYINYVMREMKGKKMSDVQMWSVFLIVYVGES